MQLLCCAFPGCGWTYLCPGRVKKERKKDQVRRANNNDDGDRVKEKQNKVNKANKAQSEKNNN